MIYEWGTGRRFAVDAQVVGGIVERIAEDEGGVCTPGAFVDAARPESSPVHGLFEWNDAAAGEAWRRQQARMVINSVRIVVEESEARPPAFVHIRTAVDGENREGYAETMSVVLDEDWRGQVLAEALGRLRAFRRRYESLSELSPVWKALDALDLQEVS